MAKLKRVVALETAFAQYSVDELIGEGGAGRVYGASDSAGNAVAVKVLISPSTDKRRRFKNEIGFLQRATHRNLVKVIDHGVASGELNGPFYVMDRYDGNLRQVAQTKWSPEEILGYFAQILDGVEAAHLHGATHRDLKPENILSKDGGKALAIADFGVASFSADQLTTLVETAPTQRLANFQYAAPEQRVPGRETGAPADIYSLGLILNEMFTGSVPHGTDYLLVASAAPDYAFLDRLVAAMIRQNPSERPQSIAHVKAAIEKYRADAVSQQRLSKLTGSVIPDGEIDDPLAFDPPEVVDANWNGAALRIVLDRPVTHDWIEALRNMGSYSTVMGYDPIQFQFRENVAAIDVREHVVQSVLDSFKNWLPIATRVLKQRLEAKLAEEKHRRSEALKREREAEEARIRVNQGLRI